MQIIENDLRYIHSIAAHSTSTTLQTNKQNTYLLLGVASGTDVTGAGGDAADATFAAVAVVGEVGVVAPPPSGGDCGAGRRLLRATTSPLAAPSVANVAPAAAAASMESSMLPVLRLDIPALLDQPELPAFEDDSS